MGLIEKRAIEELKASRFPNGSTAVTSAAGFPLELDVRWDTLMADGYANSYGEWEKILSPR